MTRNLWIAVAVIALVILASIALFVFNSNIVVSGSSIGP